MINIQSTIVTAHTLDGTFTEALIPGVVQQNFLSIHTEFRLMEDRQVEMSKRLWDLEQLIQWVTKNHPNVVQEYVVTNATKEKLGVA